MRPHMNAERTVTMGVSITPRKERVTSDGAHDFRPIAMFGKEGTVIMVWVSLLGRMLRNHQKSHISFQIASDSQALVMVRVSSSRTFLHKGVSCSSMDLSTHSWSLQRTQQLSSQNVDSIP